MNGDQHSYPPHTHTGTTAPFSAPPSRPPSSGHSHYGSDDYVLSVIQKNLYKDHSGVTTEEVEAEVRTRRMPSLRKGPTFPMKLHSLLSDPDAEGAITWLPHGRAWKILDQEKFQTTMLPRHFDHGNLASFMRQVNGWDFQRIAKVADENGYYHELFLRGMPHLCLRMSRTKKSKHGAGILCSPKLLSIAPDFYRYSQDHPLPDETDRAVPASPAPPSCSTSKYVAEGASEKVMPPPNQPPGEDLQARYSNLATDALQRYVSHDFVEAQKNMSISNLQAFQQRLQARRELVNDLRNIASLSSQASVPIPTIYNTSAVGTSSVGNPSAASNVGLLLELARANQGQQQQFLQQP